MFAITRKVLVLLLLACIAIVTAGCLSINKPPDSEPKKDVNIGGPHGVTVER